ncbi:Fic/DOC family [Rothia kristinae]|uniref:Fic family protein n=1 Tax=Rothia kristinae TaxID=37923 RepID=UPI0007745C7A|nr:Fic family protein [Rothia kristinae]SQC37610.1 Fic/DOC family [Rothia kristinae]
MLLRSEAASSSQIENLTASARAIFSAALGVKRSRNAEEIAANTRALRAALTLSEKLTAPTILRMHAVLMECRRGTPPPGRWRDEPVWIGTRSDSPIGATYVAPDHGSVPELMEDLVRFIARTDLPPLVRTALAQAQFDTIHPFTDGNGLTGRALAQAMPRHRDVTRNVAAPVSAGLLADVEGYHAAVDVYRAGDLDPIVGQFNLAAPRAVANGRRLVEEIDDTRARWDERLTPRKNSNAWRLLDMLPRRPVLTSTTAAEELGVRQPDGIRRCAR